MSTNVNFDDDYLYVAVNSMDPKSVPLDTVNKNSYFSNPIFPLNLPGVPTQYEVAMLNIDFIAPNNNYSGIYIYSDICNYSRVGSSMINLLSRIPRPTSDVIAGTSAHYDVRNLEWRPLNSTTINQITIKMAFSDGNIVPGTSTLYSTFISLAIRKKP